MGTLSKLRRMVRRDGLSVREAARRLGISRNTASKWLAMPAMVEPRYPKRVAASSVLDPYKERLAQWLKADAHRGKRDRRGVKAMFEALRALGYGGSCGPVYRFAAAWQRSQDGAPRSAAFVPLSFEPGEAFQFDWSCEYAFVAGLRRRLEVAHVKLAASRAFLLVAYPSQAHEMLFDAHAQAFAVFGGVPRRGIYDNMRTAVDRVGAGKLRSINARFEAMTGHYLFEPEFCNRAAGWEKGIVEKNVQDRRRGLWREAGERRWASLAELNAWLREACVGAWKDMAHPEWSHLSVADVWQDEQVRLMPAPAAFDGYVEQPVRVSATALVHFQRNRYSVPCEWVHAVASLRAYPDRLVLLGPDGQRVSWQRCFERDQTLYDWTHYISLVERKPGALRNGAPFKTMPEPLRLLQQQLLRHGGGDRVMAQVLTAIPLHGLEAVLVAVELALQAGRVSADHVLNLLARLQEPTARTAPIRTPLTLSHPARADVHRYDRLRQAGSTEEADHVQ
ncbi:MAG TPA: IS21 family transposase [Pseudoxanthomonas sp.]|nr:IS21 family transposase [Pseudoxanthomonas sp.]